MHAILIILSLALSSLAATVDWWENSSIYQIYPRSWKDSDGNGIGDIKGITEKLDYLKDIGITATWLSPIFKSPMVDNGYDISNFTEIDPIFGTMEDFDDLITKAKKIGVKIILDFVPNHSSDDCEWFRKSVNREDGYDDFYVWADGLDDPKTPGKKLPPSNWVSVFGGSMWAWNEKRQQFYLHQFLKQQPDFNFRNSKVLEKMFEVLEFWLDRGVAGFRIDAVPHMVEKVNEDGSYPDEDKTNHYYTQNQYETVELLYKWRDFLDSYGRKHGGDTRILLAEAYSPIDMLDKYCGNSTHNGIHIPFNFNMLNLKNTSDAREIQSLADSWMNVMWKKHKMANWLTGNHDLTRIIESVGKNKTDLAYFLLAGLPGVTITYYGEEIAMSDVISCQNCSRVEQRSFGRSPFQWNDDVSAGFSSSNTTWLPISEHYKTVNVKNELVAARSSLKVFKALQALKNTSAFRALKEENGFKYGAINDQVFEIVRSSSDEEYRILINWGNNEEQVGSLLSSNGAKNDLMEYVVISQNSPHNIGDKVKVADIKLSPLEGIALRKQI